MEDTGTGLTEEQQSRVFAPFERLGNAVTEDGFGLGLAIVSDTVKLLNGSITVESEPGKGSRFTVSLPLPKAEETTATEKTTVKHSTLSGCSVLAIDNNGMLLDMMKEMYRQSGVKCDTCQSVDELTDRMRTKDYDLLVTDLKMPEVNGYGVLELLRTSEIGNSQTIPVVAATAAGYVEEKELTEKGFAAVLYKPYSIDELLAVTEKSWGGNVRELKRVVHLAVLHTEGDTVTADTLEFDEMPLTSDASLEMDDMEKKQIIRALEQAKGNRKLAAALLGIGRTTLYNKIRLYGIKYKE